MTAANWSVMLHGGAGVIGRGALTDAQDAGYRRALAAALAAARIPLMNGASAIDAVEAGVRSLEACPLFNAAVGATFTFDGRIELDAAIMNGATLAAGAVAGIDCTLHPVTLARAVMDHSSHVMLVGEGAASFAREQGIAVPGSGELVVEERWLSLAEVLEDRGLIVPPRPPGPRRLHDDADLVFDEGKYGTVGVVARDVQGHIAAATSTGGVLAKKWGRVGDTPVIGAGTYADDKSCAISATGQGEYFIRTVAGRSVAALVEYAGLSLESAIAAVLERISGLGGKGGLIGIAADGTMGWLFNTPGMFRARQTGGSAPVICIYGDEQ